VRVSHSPSPSAAHERERRAHDVGTDPAPPVADLHDHRPDVARVDDRRRRRRLVLRRRELLQRGDAPAVQLRDALRVGGRERVRRVRARVRHVGRVGEGESRRREGCERREGREGERRGATVRRRGERRRPRRRVEEVVVEAEEGRRGERRRRAGLRREGPAGREGDERRRLEREGLRRHRRRAPQAVALVVPHARRRRALGGLRAEADERRRHLAAEGRALRRAERGRRGERVRLARRGRLVEERRRGEEGERVAASLAQVEVRRPPRELAVVVRDAAVRLGADAKTDVVVHLEAVLVRSREVVGREGEGSRRSGRGRRALVLRARGSGVSFVDWRRG